MSRGFLENSEETVGLCPSQLQKERTANSYGSVVPGLFPTRMPDLFPTFLMPFNTFSEIFKNWAGPSCRLMIIIRFCIRSTWSQQTPGTTCKSLTCIEYWLFSHSQQEGRILSLSPFTDVKAVIGLSPAWSIWFPLGSLPLWCRFGFASVTL